MDSPKQALVPLKKQEAKDTMTEILRLSGKLFDIYKNNLPTQLPVELLQSTHGFDLFLKIFLKQKKNPNELNKLQKVFLQKYFKIYTALLNRVTFKNVDLESFNEPHNDKRFLSPIWKESPYFEFLKRTYYLTAKYSLKWLNSIEDLDKKTRQQLHFYIKNFLDYLAPTNYFWMNPEVIQSTLQSGGKNLLDGFKNCLEDLVLNDGRLNVRMTDLKTFKVGKNLAITPGKVIYQNDLIQLIQYSPTTKDVYKVPILFIPPWINKYYILDLSPENSLVKWLVEQGFTVYMISWVNPDPKLAHKKFEDYMLEGPLQSLDIITKSANCTSVHMVGYCIGGTLLACTLAYMKKTKDSRTVSSTFCMSLLNFSNPGEIGVFIDEPQINALEKLMKSSGYLNGHLLDLAFNILRPNELFWPYFINNYLLGKPSKPFDLLYWNADSSNLAYKMYIFYLRNMYLYNRLREPGGIKLNDVPIDLKDISIPSFFLASETDHITLWKSIYSGVKLLRCPVEFVLSESGHVRGVINPPSQNKYGFRTNENFGKSKPVPAKPKDWLASSTKHKGSWWQYWANWLLSHDSKKVSPRDPAQNSTILEEAPGSYVLKRI